MTTAEATTLTRIGRLLDDEAELREEARRIELNPSRSEDARRLFALARAGCARSGSSSWTDG